MKAQPGFLALTVILLLAGALGAQGFDTELVTPFAQNLRVALKDPQVRISWEDASGLGSAYLLYRHGEEVTAENLGKATLVAELLAGTTTYTDVPPDTGTWYYAVLLRDKDNVVYDLLIPYRNKTITGVEITTKAVVTDLATDISNIRARVQGQTIVVSALSSRNNRTVRLYRSSKIIDSHEALDGAVLIETLSGTTLEYADKAIPGIPYFYAMVDAELEDPRSLPLVKGKNTLATSVEIDLENVELSGVTLPGPRTVRPFPLPRINELLGGSQLPSRSGASLSPTVNTRINLLAPPSSSGRAGLPPLDLLPSDRGAQGVETGYAASLQEILRNYFVKGEYAEALARLRRLSILGLRGDTATKTRYYMALSRLGLEDWSGAVLDLLMVRNELRSYVEPWLDLALERL